MAKTAKNPMTHHTHDKTTSIYNLPFKVDPYECPFREFRDNELTQDLWGLGPQATRLAILRGNPSKSSADQLWFDEHTQPLPRSVRRHLFQWRRAEEVAQNKFEAEVVLFEESASAKMSLVEMQLSHPLVLKRSSFARRVLSTCFMLERNEHLITEHQWDNFTCHFHEGWRPRYLVYSPTMKPGGGLPHRPSLSKNGCYLVRLFYLGAWRCVWVNDQVPVSLMGAPLLPFAPMVTPTKTGPVGKSLNTNLTSNTIHLWPLLLCKALLKLAAPDISASSYDDEDENMEEFSIMHALTGCMRLRYLYRDVETLWDQIYSNVQVFVWDDDEETTVATAKKSVKKPVAKDVPVRTSMVTVLINDTAEYPPYKLPGITPAFEMELIITMCRDLPLKRPLAEPEVPLWKTFRWVDWAKRHGLYDEYECPKTRFLKVNGLLKLSHAPHLLDVGSTESITQAFRIEQEQGPPATRRERKLAETRAAESAKDLAAAQNLQLKEELREWILFDSLSDIVNRLNITFYPSQFQFTTCTSHNVLRIQKVPNKALDILAPKNSPTYLQFDSPTNNLLKFSLSALHPRILLHSNFPIEYYIEATYLLLEVFEWFKDPELVVSKAYIETRAYDSVEVMFPPGRHYCRLWIHSHVQWHVAVLSESSLLLGTRDVMFVASTRECPWAAGFLNNLGLAFGAWLKLNRNNPNIMALDRDFYKAYAPDLKWDLKKVGYSKKLLHWMFRQALQSMLYTVLNNMEFQNVCNILRGVFRDPEFGIFRTGKPLKLHKIKAMVESDPCVCPLPETSSSYVTLLDDLKSVSESPHDNTESMTDIMERLLTPPVDPFASNVCELATDDVSCAYLREERQKEIERHEAAIVIQANWKGYSARKALKRFVVVSPDILKLLNDRLYGHVEPLSMLMNEFFRMFPSAKSAYSVSSALSGTTGIRQYTGVVHATPKCEWIPYFQATFYCHSPVKVHFDITSTIPYNVFNVFDNDTEQQILTCYNAHNTYNFAPNSHGYTVIGHGTQKENKAANYDVYWQLSVLASLDRIFHVCDYDDTACKESQSLTSSTKLFIEEIFLPNRKNILGSVQLFSSSHEFVNFRVVSTSPDLEMEAILYHQGANGAKEVSRTSGRGEIFWPYIHVEGRPVSPSKKTISWGMVPEANKTSGQSSRGLLKNPNQKNRTRDFPKGTKLGKGSKEANTEIPNQYTIEVIAPNGWPLSKEQWRRIDEIQNNGEFMSPTPEPQKKAARDKATVREKKEDKISLLQYPQIKPQEGDAYITLECSYPESGIVTAHRDDTRDLEFSMALRSWNINEAGRNVRGAEIRHEFREEYLIKEILPTTEALPEEDEDSVDRQQGPSLASELLEAESAVSGDHLGLVMPEPLKDQFKSLSFVSTATLVKEDKPGLVYTSALADVQRLKRHEKIEEAMARMRQLQEFNLVHQLERQKKRFQLIENVFVDGSWTPEQLQAFEALEEAMANEMLARTLSATKKAKTGNQSTNASVAGRKARKGKKKN